MNIDANVFLEENKGLLINLTNKFHLATPKFAWDDLMQEANLAATRALEKFDPDRGSKITTYVYSTVKRSIRDFVRKNKHDLYVSPHQQVKDFKAKQAEEKIAPEEGGLGQGSKVAFKFASTKSPMAIRLDWNSEGRGNMSNLIPSGEPPAIEKMISDEQKEILAREVSNLPNREQEVIKARFFDGQSLADIARIQNVSRQRIDQISKRAISRLKEKVSDRLGN